MWRAVTGRGGVMCTEIDYFFNNSMYRKCFVVLILQEFTNANNHYLFEQFIVRFNFVEPP